MSIDARHRSYRYSNMCLILENISSSLKPWDRIRSKLSRTRSSRYFTRLRPKRWTTPSIGNMASILVALLHCLLNDVMTQPSIQAIKEPCPIVVSQELGVRRLFIKGLQQDIYRCLVVSDLSCPEPFSCLVFYPPHLITNVNRRRWKILWFGDCCSRLNSSAQYADSSSVMVMSLLVESSRE